MVKEFMNITGMEKEITELIKTNNRMISVVNASCRGAALAAAKIIKDEQKRIVSQKYPRFAGYLNHKVFESGGSGGNPKKVKVVIGYSGDNINKHMEVLSFEFGKPGRSQSTLRRRKNNIKTNIKLKKGRTRTFISATDTDTMGRKIGVVPSFSHIRVAWENKKDEAKDKYNEILLEEVNKKWEET